MTVGVRETRAGQALERNISAIGTVFAKDMRQEKTGTFDGLRKVQCG